LNVKAFESCILVAILSLQGLNEPESATNCNETVSNVSKVSKHKCLKWPK